MIPYNQSAAKTKSGDAKGGNLIRIDNFLDNLESYLNKLEFTLDRLKAAFRRVPQEGAASENTIDFEPESSNFNGVFIKKISFLFG